MIRWIALGLVAANLLYGAWQWAERPTAAPAPPAADYSGVPRLVLLRERGPAPSLEAGGTGAPPDRGETDRDVESPDRRSGLSASPTRQPAWLEYRQELSARQPTLCAMLGPFPERISARQVQDRLADAHIAAELQAREVVVRRDQWVHIPPLPSRREALELLRELQGLGIDSFLITGGDLANGISLGIFSRESSAQAVVARHRELGREIAIRELPRTRAEHWLFLTPAAAAAVTPALLERLGRGGVEAGFLRQPCNSVARGPQFD